MVLVRPDVHGDERGRFVETYRRSWFPHGREMVQGNRSEKQAGALVGLHYHLHQADYWYVLRGRARVVLHDLRVGLADRRGDRGSSSSTGTSTRGVYIPPGVAHGFAALTDILLCLPGRRLLQPDGRARAGVGRPGRSAPTGGSSDPVLSTRDQTNPRRGDIPDEIRPRLAH